jgi:hypothetical protein
MQQHADYAALAITVGVAALCSWILVAYVQPKRPAVRPHLKRLLMWTMAAVLILWAASEFSDATNTTHGAAAGTLRTMQTTTYSGDRPGMIACIEDCRTLLLNFDADAAKAVNERPVGWRFRIGFLEQRREIAPEVSGFDVVDVWDGATDENLYHVDTQVHWPRVGLLAVSAILLIVTGYLYGHNPAEPAPETEETDDGRIVQEEPRE